MQLYEFSDRAECERALLDEITAQLQQTIDEKKSASIALAGGNTPKPFYQTLSEQPIHWQNVKVTLTDERWVDSDHEDSNERMLAQTLRQNKGHDCVFFPLKNSEPSPVTGQMRTADMLIKNIPALDFAILGMGDDGHFASIFPAMDNTSALLDLKQSAPCLPAYPEGKPARMSLTLAYLLKAKALYLFITGKEKHQVLQAMQDSNVEHPLPIYYLIHQTVCPLHVYWSAS